jgi:hypothetical protein
VRLLLPNDVAEKVMSALQDAGRREIGGVLMGEHVSESVSASMLTDRARVFGTGAGWRDLPEEEFGPWRTVYGHYRQWREEGLWQRIVQMLQLR